MTYLVDTDWVVDWLAGRAMAVGLLRSLAPAGLAISLMTLGEVYEGIYFGRSPGVQSTAFRALLRASAFFHSTSRS